jgi:hypothetical protein
VHDGLVFEQPQNVSEGVDGAQASHVSRVTKGVFGERRHVGILHGGMRDFRRVEDLSQLVETAVGDLRHTDIYLGAADTAFTGGAGQDCKERGLAHLRQADYCCFHGVRDEAMGAPG